MMALEELPTDLPPPVDDGGADHLLNRQLPTMELAATTGGTIDVAEVGAPWAVLYVYPMTGRPDRDLPADWEMIPGARGCTPQTCSFRDHQAELSDLGAEIYGISVQSTEYQAEMVERLHVEFPVLADPAMKLGRALDLPTMEAGGMTLYKRLTMIVRGGRVEHVMYPVFPPDRNAADVVEWLRNRIAPKADARASWNERYEAAAALYGAEPNQFIAAELSGLSPRRVLDLGCGQGRNSVWLAAQGHQVTGLDISDVGIAHGNELAAAVGVGVDFRAVDVVNDWEPDEEYDVVILSYLQLPQDMRRRAHAKAITALAPGGTLVLVAHHTDNLEQGVGGPPMPEVLFSESELAEDFAELDIKRNKKVLRDVEREGELRVAHDILVRAIKRS
ncbi:MAG: redoxin family protein [bacterium]|nr:redoxin family protein [bacterium]